MIPFNLSPDTIIYSNTGKGMKMEIGKHELIQ